MARGLTIHNASEACATLAFDVMAGKMDLAVGLFSLKSIEMMLKREELDLKREELQLHAEIQRAKHASRLSAIAAEHPTTVRRRRARAR